VSKKKPITTIIHTTPPGIAPSTAIAVSAVVLFTLTITTTLRQGISLPHCSFSFLQTVYTGQLNIEHKLTSLAVDLSALCYLMVGLTCNQAILLHGF